MIGASGFYGKISNMVPRKKEKPPKVYHVLGGEEYDQLITQVALRLQDIDWPNPSAYSNGVAQRSSTIQACVAKMARDLDRIDIHAHWAGWMERYNRIAQVAPAKTGFAIHLLDNTLSQLDTIWKHMMKTETWGPKKGPPYTRNVAFVTLVAVLYAVELLERK